MHRIVKCKYLNEIRATTDCVSVCVSVWNFSDPSLQRYDDYNGFVILHGTDALAYTASALSFMLEDLGKCVVLTGSMLPMSHVHTGLTHPTHTVSFPHKSDAHPTYPPILIKLTHTQILSLTHTHALYQILYGFFLWADAKKNVVLALLTAGFGAISEVVVVFGSKILRGSRVQKVNCTKMEAFDTPNFPPLGETLSITAKSRLLYKDVYVSDSLYKGLCPHR